MVRVIFYGKDERTVNSSYSKTSFKHKPVNNVTRLKRNLSQCSGFTLHNIHIPNFTDKTNKALCKPNKDNVKDQGNSNNSDDMEKAKFRRHSAPCYSNTQGYRHIIEERYNSVDDEKQLTLRRVTSCHSIEGGNCCGDWEMSNRRWLSDTLVERIMNDMNYPFTSADEQIQSNVVLPHRHGDEVEKNTILPHRDKEIANAACNECERTILSWSHCQDEVESNDILSPCHENNLCTTTLLSCNEEIVHSSVILCFVDEKNYDRIPMLPLQNNDIPLSNEGKDEDSISPSTNVSIVTSKIIIWFSSDKEEENIPPPISNMVQSKVTIIPTHNDNTIKREVDLSPPIDKDQCEDQNTTVLSSTRIHDAQTNATKENEVEINATLPCYQEKHLQYLDETISSPQKETEGYSNNVCLSETMDEDTLTETSKALTIDYTDLVVEKEDVTILGYSDVNEHSSITSLHTNVVFEKKQVIDDIASIYNEVVKEEDINEIIYHIDAHHEVNELICKGISVESLLPNTSEEYKITNNTTAECTLFVDANLCHYETTEERENKTEILNTACTHEGVIHGNEHAQEYNKAELKNLTTDSSTHIPKSTEDEVIGEEMTHKIVEGCNIHYIGEGTHNKESEQEKSHSFINDTAEVSTDDDAIKDDSRQKIVQTLIIHHIDEEVQHKEIGIHGCNELSVESSGIQAEVSMHEAAIEEKDGEKSDEAVIIDGIEEVHHNKNAEINERCEFNVDSNNTCKYSLLIIDEISMHKATADKIDHIEEVHQKEDEFAEYNKLIVETFIMEEIPPDIEVGVSTHPGETFGNKEIEEVGHQKEVEIQGCNELPVESHIAIASSIDKETEDSMHEDAIEGEVILGIHEKLHIDHIGEEEEHHTVVEIGEYNELPVESHIAIASSIDIETEDSMREDAIEGEVILGIHEKLHIDHIGEEEEHHAVVEIEECNELPVESHIAIANSIYIETEDSMHENAIEGEVILGIHEKVHIDHIGEEEEHHTVVEIEECNELPVESHIAIASSIDIETEDSMHENAIEGEVILGIHEKLHIDHSGEEEEHHTVDEIEECNESSC